MIQADVLKKYLPEASNQSCEVFADPLSKTCEEFDIDSPKRIAAFIAQIAHESGNLRFVKENLNYSAEGLRKIFPKYFPNDEIAQQYQRKPEAIANRVYANRMGNGPENSGDGWKYRGRGLIQITGYENYAKCMKDLNVSDPNYFETPIGAARSAGWFWRTRNLNSIADNGTIDDIRRMTKIINGGFNGLDDRIKHYTHITKVMGL